MLVVADLLGVPEEQHQRFRDGFGLSENPGELGHDQSGMDTNALGWLDTYFATYIEERRREPRGDVLSDLALAKYPGRVDARRDRGRSHRDVPVRRRSGDDGAPARDVVKYLSEHPELQEELHAHRDRIPEFIEEALRLESPVKADFRLARRATTIGGTAVALSRAMPKLPPTLAPIYQPFHGSSNQRRRLHRQSEISGKDWRARCQHAERKNAE